MTLRRGIERQVLAAGPRRTLRAHLDGRQGLPVHFIAERFRNERHDDGIG